MKNKEVLYWAVLPLSVVVLVLAGIGFVVWKFWLRKKRVSRRKR